MAELYDTTVTAPSVPMAASPTGPTPYQPEQAQPYIQPIPEPTLYKPILDYGQDKGAKIFSTDGKPKTNEEFDKALEQYERTKDTPHGFKVISNPAIATIRAGFEAVAEPVRQLAGGMGESAGKIVAAPANAMLQLGEKAGLVSPGNAQGVTDTWGQRGRAIGGAAVTGLGFGTPEALGGNIGMAAAAALTSKVNPFVSTAAVGLGALVGHLFGSAATGGNTEHIASEAIGNAVLAATTHGVIGVLKSGTGYGLSTQAQKVVDDELVSMMAKKYPNLVDSPYGLQSVTSTKAGISDAVQIGIKGLRYDMDATSEALLSSLEAQIPKPGGSAFRFATKERNELKRYVNQITEQQNKMLDSIDSKDIQEEGRKVISTLQSKIKEKVKDTFINMVGGKSPAASTLADMQSDKAVNLLLNYRRETEQFVDGAHVYAALKRAGADGEFNVAKFQKEVAPYYRNPAYGSLMQQAGDIAGRGGPGINMPGGRDYLREKAQPVIDAAGQVIGGKSEAIMQLLSAMHPKTYTGIVPYNNKVFNPSATVSGNAAIKSFFNDNKVEK